MALPNTTNDVTTRRLGTAISSLWTKIKNSFVKKSGDTMTGKLVMEQPITQVITGTGTAGTSSGSPTTYYPAKWDFDLGIANPTPGDRMVIQIPVAGHDNGVFLSTDNGTTYYPVARSTSTYRLTTHYPAKAYICVVFEEYDGTDGCGKVGSIYPVTGGTARVTLTTGCWRVINDYDSGNNYERLYTGGYFYAGSTGCNPYSLVCMDNAGKFSMLISGGSGTGTSKTVNTTTKFTYPATMMYYAANNTAAANARVSSASAYIAYPGFDCRYSCNYTTTFATHSATYIECTLNSDNTWTPTTNSITQTLRSGYYYIYLGNTTSTTYSILLHTNHPILYYDGTNLISAELTLSSLSASSTNGSISVAGTDVSVYTHPTQTAYSAKGSATKVPKITTDSTGHVTSIEEVTITGVTPASHSHGNIANGGTLTDTAAAAAGNDYVVIRDADNAKIQTSTIKGTDVADAVSKKHSHSTLTLSTTAQAYDGTHTLALPSSDPYSSARTPASHTHGNIANGGTLTDTAAAAAGNDYVVIRDADNSKIQTSTIKGTDVADAVSKKHSHSTITLSTTAQAYDGTHTLALPSSDPYTSARTPASHTHGNITNDGKIGSTANLPVITGTSGAVTTGSFATSTVAVATSSAAGTANTFSRGDHTHSISLATGDSAGQVKIAGSNVSVNGWSGKEDTSNKVTSVRESSSATNAAYPTEKAVATAIENASSGDKLYANAKWGGDFRSSLAPGDTYFLTHRNVFFGLNLAAITVEYSTDGGSTWIDYGLTDTQKYNLFNQFNTGIICYCGKNTHVHPGYTGSISGTKDLSDTNIADQRLRITLCCENLANFGTAATTGKWIYANLRRIGIYMTTYSASRGPRHCVFTGLSKPNFRNGTDTWTEFGDYAIAGDSGWNSIPCRNATGENSITFGDSFDTQYSILRFEIWSEGLNNSPNAGQTGNMGVGRITGFSELCWQLSTTNANLGMYGIPCSVDVSTGLSTFSKGIKFTSRKLAVNLANTSTDTSFDGSADVTNIKVSGTLPVANGGTGQTSLASVTVGTADKPTGFSTRSTSATWGTLTPTNEYTAVTRWDTASGGSVVFADKSAQTSMQIDGYFYQNEGRYQVLDTSSTLDAAKVSGTVATATTASDYNTSSGTIKTALDGKSNSAEGVYYVVGTTDYAAWVANHAYAVNDTVNYSNQIRVCKTAHTSGSSYDSTKWNNLGTPVLKGTISGVSALYTGLKIAYKWPCTGGSSSTYLNINGLGDVYIRRNDSNITTHVPANSVTFLAYDGTYWRWADYDSNTNNWVTTMGAYCETAAATQAKTATSTNTVYTAGEAFLIRIVNANTYNGKITLNINSQGAKDIWINGAVSSSTNKTLPAGEHWCYYDGSVFHIWTDGTAQFTKLKASTFTGDLVGNADTATSATTATSAGKLTTARKTYVTLGTASTTTTRDWSGDTTIPVDGTLGVGNGGTGKSSVTSNSFLVGNGSSAMVEKTPAEVLSLIGAQAAMTEMTTQEVTDFLTELGDF